MSLRKRDFSFHKKKTTKKILSENTRQSCDDEARGRAANIARRAGYILLNSDSRWKIAVPRLGPAIIATRRPHLPGVTAAAAFTTPALFLILPVVFPLPRPSPRPPLGDPQSAVHDLVSHPRPLSLSILHAVISVLCFLLPRERSRGFYLCPLRSIRRTG